MRAAFYEAQGSAADVMQVGGLPDPKPGPGEVRLRVAVSGLCPGDMKFRTGFVGEPLAYPLIVPHQDGTGTIDQVGAGVDPGRWASVAGYTRPRAASPRGGA